MGDVCRGDRFGRGRGVLLAALHALHIGIALLILGICAVGVACSVLFAALSHLTAKAAAMQSEHDLTI